MRTGSEVRVGVITVLAIILMAAYVFYIRGYRAAADTYKVCVTFQDARGLQRGDPVRMVGVKIGEVATVEINTKPMPLSPSTSATSSTRTTASRSPPPALSRSASSR